MTKSNNNPAELGMAGFYLHELLNLLEKRKSGENEPSRQSEQSPDSGNGDFSSQPSSVKYSPMVITLLKE